MEILSRLESRIEELLSRLKQLEQENLDLKSKLSEDVARLEQENEQLREELAGERSGKDEVVARIDGLLQKLTDDEPSS